VLATPCRGGTWPSWNKKMSAADVPPLPKTGEEGQSQSARKISQSRRHRSALEVPEAEVERLLALRNNNRDARLQREKLAADRLQREQELAAAWKRRAEARALQLKQARQEQLQRNCFKHSNRLVAASPLGTEPCAERAWSNVQSPRTTTQELTMQAGGSRGLKSSMSILSVDTVVRDSLKKPAGESFQRKPSLDFVKSVRKSRTPSPCSSPVPLGNQSPRRGSHALDSEALATPRTSVAPPLPPASAPCTPPRREATGPEVSLMPRKEMLRQRQQTLLKKSDVLFYKQEMRAHFEKIQEAVEFTFLDSTKKKRPNMNLAKPVRIKETRHHAAAAGL